MTSLFQALKLEMPVRTHDVRHRPVSGWFYIDMVAALNPHADREETIQFLPQDRIVRNFRNELVRDYSTPQAEYEAHFFPLNKVFDSDDWSMGFQEHWNFERDKIVLWNAFRRDVIGHFSTYQLPIIELGRATPREAVCQVFEKVNTGGVTLTVFELLTATFAADEFDLRQDWMAREASWSEPRYRVLREVSNTDFLQAVTLLATRTRRDAAATTGVEEDRRPRVGCKRADMLGLTLEEYRTFAPIAVEGLKAAARFLHGQYVFDTRFLPYGTQLIPLSAIFAVLGSEAETAAAQHKIGRWYWCGVFGELYGGTIETRFSRDLPDVVAWVRAGTEEPRTVFEAQFAPTRLQTLRTRNSAAYKGIYAILLKEGALDWRTGTAATVADYFDDAVDIHHIFPKHWCEQQKIDPRVYNSIINKTPLSARTNRIIGGRSPSDYLPRLSSSTKIGPDVLDKFVATHMCEPALMRANDFETFYTTRKAALLARIGDAMGKVIDDTIADPGETTDPDDDTEDH